MDTARVATVWRDTNRLGKKRKLCVEASERRLRDKGAPVAEAEDDAQKSFFSMRARE